MWSDREVHVWRWLLVLAGVLAGLALAATAEGARGTRSHAGHATVSAPAPDTLPAAPDVRDTPANLQAAFGNEVNAKERYVQWMRQAAVEGYPSVARLFRACADAESIHARRFVEGITASSGSARAILDRVQVGSTADNLRAALSCERWEAERYYPALLARARAEHWPVAVRAITSALATEHQHVRLLEAALAGLDQRADAGTLYVCSYCGRTVSQPEHGKCPQCFAPASRFIHVP